jgi:hypothetical protein
VFPRLSNPTKSAPPSPRTSARAGTGALALLSAWPMQNRRMIRWGGWEQTAEVTAVKRRRGDKWQSLAKLWAIGCDVALAKGAAAMA